jgi:hypothetical protein
MKRNPWRAALLAVGISLSTSSVSTAVVTFESVPLGGGNGVDGVWNGENGAGKLETEGATFTNSYTAAGSSYYWSGFAASNRVTLDPEGDWYDEHQYLSVPRGGANGSATYGIFYGWGSVTFDGVIDMVGKGSSITNNEYAMDSMLNGDFFAKKFGGASGNDADWFKLTITGSLGGVTGTSIEFYLADFRFSDNSQDYIITDWTFVDFSALGLVDKLDFALSSSDNDPVYGMNTPAYFAIDDIGAVPEPSSLAFVSVALGLLGRRKRQV